jgi:hypothetical protein
MTSGRGSDTNSTHPTALILHSYWFAQSPPGPSSPHSYQPALLLVRSESSRSQLSPQLSVYTPICSLRVLPVTALSLHSYWFAQSPLGPSSPHSSQPALLLVRSKSSRSQLSPQLSACIPIGSLRVLPVTALLTALSQHSHWFAQSSPCPSSLHNS